MTTPQNTTSIKELRQFAFIMAGMLCVIFGALLPWLWNYGFPMWPWIVALLFALCGAVRPSVLAPIYRAWMKLANVLGWINSRIILVVIFYGMFLPLGLGMRLLGKDPMGRRLDRERQSYRHTINREQTPSDLEKPF